MIFFSPFSHVLTRVTLNGSLKLCLQSALSRNNGLLGGIGAPLGGTGTPLGKPLEGGVQLVESVKALALCHNVTPVLEAPSEAGDQSNVDVQESEVVIFQKDVNLAKRHITYQASSPDEVALVKWTESVGLALVERDLTSLCLETPDGQSLRYDILQIFPFTSETKRMGIIVRDRGSGQITFYMKGADVVMMSKVQYNDWVEEECGNMAREGLRTLVVGKKVLSEEQYASFEICYKQAKLSVSDRTTQVSAVLQSLEENMELLCLTGVEDQLQTDVRPTLELLRNAGIKVWMLTGDKMETATSIALSSRLIARTQNIYSFKQVLSRSEVHNELNSFRRKNDYALVISGDSLQLCLEHYEAEFVDVACQCPAVICCRCSPTHKAQVVSLLQQHTKRPVCAIVTHWGHGSGMLGHWSHGSGMLGHWGHGSGMLGHWSHGSGMLGHWGHGSGMLGHWGHGSGMLGHWSHGSGMDAGSLGPRVGDAGSLEPRVGDAGSLGPRVGDAGSLGPRVGDAGSLGPRVGDAGSLGPWVGDAGSLGPRVGDAGSLGPWVGDAGSLGPWVGDAGSLEPWVGDAGSLEPWVGDAGSLEPRVGDAGSLGPWVGDAGSLGPWVGDAGSLLLILCDGGNDVSMIQAANVGIGILGKEGKQASLAADFSITHFSHISRLLVWHGRNCYKRSAALSQFVIHRGLIISVMQALFSAVFYFAAVPLYEGILMVGYATIYTMAPVFSMVLDEDVSPDIALTYPELYRELMKGRALSLKTFFVWVLISIYQGGVIMLLGFLLFEALFVHVVAITFTALVLNELLMVALTIRTWHGLMVLAQLFSVVIYVLSLVVLNGYFDGSFLLTFGFVWKTLVIAGASCVPLVLLKLSYRKCAPPSYAKLLKQNSMFRNCCKVNC
ncbi:hypothetical protein EMCRGX_G030921 [Ephydatia muelleri]